MPCLSVFPFSAPQLGRHLWLYPDFIEGNFKYKKWRTNPCESILRFSEPDRIRTYDRLLRREVLYPFKTLNFKFLKDYKNIICQMSVK